MLSRADNLVSRFSGRQRVPRSVSMVQPKIHLLIYQFMPPRKALFKKTEFVSFPETVCNTSFRDWRTRYVTRCYWAGFPWDTTMRSSM